MWLLQRERVIVMHTSERKRATQCLLVEIDGDTTEGRLTETIPVRKARAKNERGTKRRDHGVNNITKTLLVDELADGVDVVDDTTARKKPHAK
jgi:hypothetical protein